jgi:predicted RNA polymerase sigma factor
VRARRSGAPNPEEAIRLTRWLHRLQIDEGTAPITAALPEGEVGPYQLQAARLSA